MAVGVAATSLYAITAATLWNYEPPLVFGAGTAVSALAAIIPDIDADKSLANKGATRVIRAVAAAVVVVMLASRIFRLNIVQQFGIPECVASAVPGLICLFALCIIGKDTPHRSFTHSFLCLAAMSYCIYMIYPPVTPYFAIAYGTHLFLDVFNYRGETLLFPLPNQFRLKLCKSDGLVNKMLFLIGSPIAILLIGARIAMYVFLPGAVLL